MGNMLFEEEGGAGDGWMDGTGVSCFLVGPQSAQ